MNSNPNRNGTLFALFACLLLLKLFLARYVIFEDRSLFNILITDAPTILIGLTLIELFARKRKAAAYMAYNTILTSVYFAVIMYHQYFGIIVTYKALKQANQAVQVKASIFDLLHPEFLLIFSDIVLICLLYPLSRSLRNWFRSRSRQGMDRRIAYVLLSVSLLISFINIFSFRDIVNEIKQAERMGIVNYELLTLLSDVKNAASKSPPPNITLQDVQRLKRIRPVDSPAGWALAAGRNIISVQIEALQTFPLDKTIDGQEITPVLNRLRKESIYFPNVFQTVGQGNTSDAEFVMNTSLYPPGNDAASQSYTHKDLPSLPKLLKERGYLSYTFHTNNVEFWNRNELYAALGFDRYFDKAFFGHSDWVHFGASDEVLYRNAVDVLADLGRSGQPFYAQLVSMSSHHPFNLPREKRMLTLPEAMEDTLVGDYLQSVHYADMALGVLIERLKQEGLWNNCILIVYGDHVGLPINTLSDKEKALLDELLGHRYDRADMLNVPLLFTIPGITGGEIVESVGGQIDIMPTLANLLGLPLGQIVYFGQDLLNQPSNLLGQRYYLPSGSFINDEVLFIPGEAFEDGTFISFRTPAFAVTGGFAMDWGGHSGGVGRPNDRSTDAGALSQDLLNRYRDDYDRALRLLKMCELYIKGLPNRPEAL